MILTDFPVSDLHGWGVCGSNIIRELSNYVDLRILPDTQIYFLNVNDYDFYRSKILTENEINDFNSDKIRFGDCPILREIRYRFPEFHSINAYIRGSLNVGYTFFEHNIITQKDIEILKKDWDIVVTGAKWCEDVLKAKGLQNVFTILQGINPEQYNTSMSEKQNYHDKFVIFSGGQFSFRKGQDIVIKAFKILQDKYDDIFLIASWYSAWHTIVSSMQYSRHIRFALSESDNVMEQIYRILVENEIDLNKVLLVQAVPNSKTAEIYRDTDIGLFTNRCEGGTNLVLMEYMACGKPVIASFNSGHKDILSGKNSIRIMNMGKTYLINEENAKIAIWDEPDLDEVVSHIEWAYHNRENLGSSILLTDKFFFL